VSSFTEGSRRVGRLTPVLRDPRPGRRTRVTALETLRARGLLIGGEDQHHDPSSDRTHEVKPPVDSRSSAARLVERRGMPPRRDIDSRSGFLGRMARGAGSNGGAEAESTSSQRRQRLPAVTRRIFPGEQPLSSGPELRGRPFPIQGRRNPSSSDDKIQNHDPPPDAAGAREGRGLTKTMSTAREDPPGARSPAETQAGPERSSTTWAPRSAASCRVGVNARGVVRTGPAAHRKGRPGDLSASPKRREDRFYAAACCLPGKGLDMGIWLIGGMVSRL